MRLLYSILPLCLVLSPLLGSTPTQSPPQTAKSQLSPPNPDNLEPLWWEYYDVDVELLRKRIDQTKKVLLSATEPLNAEEEERASPLLDEVLIGLETLAERKGETAETPPLPKPPMGEYSLEKFLSLGKTAQETKQEKELLQRKISLREESIRSMNYYLDILIASYLAETRGLGKKIVQGFEIMAMRIALLIEEQELLSLQNVLSYQEKKESLLDAEISYGRKHLQVSSSSLPQIEENIASLEQELALARSALYKAQLSSSSRDLAEQTVLSHLASKAILEVKLINAEMTRWIYFGATELSSEKLTKLHTDLNSWKGEIGAIRRNLPEWKKEAALYMQGLFEELAQSGKQEKGSLALVEETLLKLQLLENQSKFYDFLQAELSYLVKEQFSTPVDRLANAWYSWTASLKSQSKWFRQSFFKVGETPITPFSILKLILFIALAYLLGKAVQRWIKQFGKANRSISQAAIYTLSRLAYFTIFYLGILIAFTSIGIDFTAFAFIAGAITFWLGLGFINIVQNFVAGFILLLDKKMRVGDFISLSSGEEGTITDIHMRSTTISTPDNLKILVPNIEFIMNKCTNWTLSGQSHRICVPFKIAYGHDKNEIRKLITDCAKKISLTDTEREPQVWLMLFGEKALEFELVVWINDYLLNKQTMNAQSIYLWAIETTLQENHIGIITK